MKPHARQWEKEIKNIKAVAFEQTIDKAIVELRQTLATVNVG